MPTRITRDILESYISCKYKAFLKLTGQKGIKSDYESLLEAVTSEARWTVVNEIVARIAQDQIERSTPLTTSLLTRGATFILDATLEDDPFALTFDGLKRVGGVSALGDFLYIPMLVSGAGRVRKEHKLLLEVYALVLSRYQGAVPGRGLIWYGRECRATSVRLDPGRGEAKRTLSEVEKLCSGEAPTLFLNEHCSICEFRQRCLDQALREDNLSLLRGLSEKQIKHYSKKGIFTVTQLAHTFRPRRKPKRARQPSVGRQPALQAMAIRDRKIYVLGKPEVPSSPVTIYLDVESNPDAGYVYLIGMIIVENGAERCLSYWADNASQESSIFEAFVAEVTRYEDFLVFCYGNYERAFLARMRKTAKRKKPVDRILAALVNALTLIYVHVYFPTYSNGLKEVGRYLGYSWTEASASGIQSIVWRLRWETTHEAHWKQTIVTYNLEDCAALRKVTELLRRICDKADSEAIRPDDDGTGTPVAFVKDIERLGDYHKWGRLNFVQADYDFVNNCAYFDYQRDRVFVRTSPTIRKSRKRKKSSNNRRVRASTRLVIVASRCPACKGKEVLSGIKKQVRTQEPRVKRAFDLVLTGAGVRRRVIECRTSVHRCSTCGHEFVPDEHTRLDKHFHGLKSWAMFHHVEHRLSLNTVGKILEELFGIRVFAAELHMFKSLMAGYHKGTYRKLLNKILSGQLLHADETEVTLQNGKGYVWVFTNLEDVVYLYRPSREADFLRPLLKNFKGVLVSDFYSAYDAIDCPQQRCLVHLIRDINQLLLENPFDEELKSVTQHFGRLLRAIVTTADEHGLKRRHLGRHQADVWRFFELLEKPGAGSEATAELKARMLKHRDRLFTFLDYDGVPWNNNNAEHAIKQFAYYRELTVGTMREGGLSDYLLLLSICQSCRYKGVSFLKFLLSKERDLDAFCAGRRHKRRSPLVELYPKGFVPSHLERAHKSRGKSKQEDKPSA
jgi:predicted RecB family nuclease